MRRGMRLRTPSLSEHQAEVVVLGSGPAGAAAAAVLAQEGHAVLIVRPLEPPAGALGESIPPSAASLLTEIGALADVERAGFVPNRGNTVWWAGAPARTERFERGATGFHVDRTGLEEVLVGVARSSGARVLDGHLARVAERTGDVWRVTCRGETGGGRTTVVHAPWIVDATGRHGFLARRMGRRPDRHTRTIALVGRWRADWNADGGAAAADRGHTLIESYEDGWVWSIPLGGDLRCFAAMVDPRYARIDGADLGSVLRKQCAKASHTDTLLRDARPAGDTWACPASLYDTEHATDDGVVLAGDAVSFIDPLSSYGVKKALSSGWMAAVAVHTALLDAGMAGSALGMHEHRERDIVRGYRAQATAYLAEAEAAHAHPYWKERAGAAREAVGADPEAAAPDLRAAFEAIRSAPRLDARPGRSVRIVEAPVIEGRRVVLDKHLRSAEHPEPVRYHRSVDLRPLMTLAPAHTDVPELWSAYNRTATPVELPEFLTALSFAFAASFLERASS